MKIHNLLKNHNDLPPIEENNRFKESREVLLLYRTVIWDGYQFKFDITELGKGFYSYEENEWYNFHDEPLVRLCDVPGIGGGQEIERIDYLLDEMEYGYPKELIDQMTRVSTFCGKKLEDEYVLIKEIVGWFDVPTFEEFMENE